MQSREMMPQSWVIFITALMAVLHHVVLRNPPASRTAPLLPVLLQPVHLGVTRHVHNILGARLRLAE